MPILLQESLWHHVLQKFFSQTHGLLLPSRNETQMVSRRGLAQPGNPGMRAAHLWMAGTVSAFLSSHMDIDRSSTEALFVCIAVSATVARAGKRNFVLWFCKTDLWCRCTGRAWLPPACSTSLHWSGMEFRNQIIMFEAGGFEANRCVQTGAPNTNVFCKQ